MSRRFRFSLARVPRRVLGERLAFVGVLVAATGVAISQIVEWWAESLSIHQWMNVWFTVGIASLFSMWGSAGVGTALIVAGIWCIRRKD